METIDKVALEHALESLLPNYHLLAQDNSIPRLMDIAAIAAFRAGTENESTRVLRHALNVLEQKGFLHYSPSSQGGGGEP